MIYRLYLPSSLAPEWGHSDFQKKSYKTKKLVNTLYIFKDFLRVLSYVDNSFGLFLIYNLVSFLRSDFNDVKLKEQIEDKSTFTRTIILGTKFLITLSSPNNSDFAYKQLLYKTIKVKRPNFIHYLDSRLKFSVVNRCRLSGIPLWGNHDCFYVCPTKKINFVETLFRFIHRITFVGASYRTLLIIK